MQVQLTQSLTALSPTTGQSGSQTQTAAQTGSVTQNGNVGSSNNSNDGKNGQQADATQVNDAVGKLNEAVKNYPNGSSLQFSVDPDSQTHIVKVIDSQTKDVIRQIPSEQAIAIAKAIGQFEGLLIKDKA
ncbi:flagellar protein FlaG [Silvimonas iriomotensis]|uniref:Flagellar protein FlaG n=1 Tax=Silvimonas iriomotensis TaxID=449662 RepID=A0ABQ2P5P8_9NEIS|nr:flagellar protein FlaG [Silvimonas iriomotensis]GGP18601.1 hypothetical protein GCM10010970_05870 [Silvimonas iriomotensis]